MADNETSYLQSSHQAISDELVNLAESIDRIFGEPRATDQVNKTSIRLTQSYDWTGRGEDTKDTEVRLNLRLPILEREGKVVTEKLRFDNQQKTSSEPLIVQSKTIGDSVRNTEKLLVERIEERQRWHLRAEPGVRIRSSFSFFEKARATKSWFTGNFVHNFSQEVTWDSASLWEESTLIQNDYALTEKLLLRFENQGDWQISDSHFYSYHGPSLIQKLSALSALSYNAQLKSQVQGATWFADTYSLSVNYRRSVYSNWAFIEFVPALLFKREQGFKGMTNLTARLEFLFGAI